MKQVSDRKRLRRGKRRAYAKLAVGGVLFVPFVLVMVACLMCALAEWIVGGNDGDPIENVIAMTAIWLGVAVAPAMLARWSLRTAEQGYSDVLSGTVTGEPESRPAAEILVRGSEEPAVAQSEGLLRSAQSGQETPREELLRVSLAEVKR